MKIAILVEGRTERAFKPHLRAFLENRIPASNLPRLDFFPCHGRLYTSDKLRRTVAQLLADRSDAVIALTDVYTGTRGFVDAADAKRKMQEWVGPNAKFHPHAAQYDFEAWLLPYWSDIQKHAGHNKSAPAGQPEKVNHARPPSFHLEEIYRIGSKGKRYSKVRDASKILTGKDLSVAAGVCPELKAFLNTILMLCGAELL